MNLPAPLQDWMQGFRRTSAPRRPTVAPVDFTGIDFTSNAPARKGSQHQLVLILIVVFGAAWVLLALRVAILSLRYDLADAVQYEQALLATKREQIVAVRKLRDPARLRRLAEERGLASPEQIISASRIHPVSQEPPQ